MSEKIQRKSMDSPDEIRVFKDNKGKAEIVTVGNIILGRGTLEPGWVWSKHVQPVTENHSCQAAHTGYIVQGRMVVKMDDGSEEELGPGEAFYVSSGHDAWIVGDETCVLIDVTGFGQHAKHS
jgi:quercetin dioxygenase-like cupin family protein